MFDSGCHPQAMEGAWPEAMCANPYVFGREATLLSRLKQLNIEPSEIRYIVASHLHLDHAGGLPPVSAGSDLCSGTGAFEDHERP